MTLHWKLQMMKKQNNDNNDGDDNMNADWVNGIRVNQRVGIKNVDDIKRDIKTAVEIMEQENKVSKKYHDLVMEICNDKSNGNLYQITISNDDKMKFDDAVFRGSQLKEMLDMTDIALNIGNVDCKPNKMRRWYDEENIRRVVDEWLAKNPGISIVYPNDNDETITMVNESEETGMLNDYEREHLESRLDELNRIKSEYDKYEWLLDVDPDHDLDAKTQIDISRLGNVFYNFLKHYELLNGISDDAKREIVESAYDIIKRHRDETCKKLKTFLYKTTTGEEK